MVRPFMLGIGGPSLSGRPWRRSIAVLTVCEDLDRQLALLGKPLAPIGRLDRVAAVAEVGNHRFNGRMVTGVHSPGDDRAKAQVGGHRTGIYLIEGSRSGLGMLGELGDVLA